MNEEPASLLGLFKKLKEDTANLVHDEIALAKTELSEKVLSAWRHLGYLAGGVLIAYGAFLLILQGLSFLLRQLLLDQGMQEGSATLLAFLIVGAWWASWAPCSSSKRSTPSKSNPSVRPKPPKASKRTSNGSRAKCHDHARPLPARSSLFLPN
jgi:uncharacterized membrane protein YqjE